MNCEVVTPSWSVTDWAHSHSSSPLWEVKHWSKGCETAPHLTSWTLPGVSSGRGSRAFVNIKKLLCHSCCSAFLLEPLRVGKKSRSPLNGFSIIKHCFCVSKEKHCYWNINSFNTKPFSSFQCCSFPGLLQLLYGAHSWSKIKFYISYKIYVIFQCRFTFSYKRNLNIFQWDNIEWNWDYRAIKSSTWL